jgi:CheY-like chemotaxis protein
LGCRANAVGDGQEAITLLSKVSYKIVFMDCAMPIIDGFCATSRIREMEKAQRKSRTSIIALTAYGNGENQRKCFEAGMDDYMSKPLKLDELANILNKWVAPTLTDEQIESFKMSEVGEYYESATVNLKLLSKLEEQFKKENQGDIVKELIDTFLDFTPMRLSQLKEATVQEDRESLIQLIHSLKSACATVGATNMTNLCHNLESLQGGFSFPLVGNTIIALDDEFLKVKEQLNEYKSN